MAAPRFAPVPPAEPVRYYESPDFVPVGWEPGRPGEIEGRQPAGERLGYQGPDQGYIITLANRARTRIRVSAGEDIDDAVKCLRCVVGMQCCENKVTSFGKREGDGDRFKIAHFTKQDHIGIFS